MSELDMIIAEASRHQRKLRHHNKRKGNVRKAITADTGHQMTADGNLSIGRKYLTQREAVEKWERRTDKLETRRAMMREGSGVRQPHKAKNKFSKEEMGTLSNYVGVSRWDNSYITKACYRKKMW